MNKITYFIATLSIIGLSILAFIGGAAVTRYDLPLAEQLNEAFDSLDALFPTKLDEGIQKYPVDSFLNRPAVHNETNDKALLLLTVRFSNTAYLLDRAGKIIYRWTAPFYKVWPNPPHVRRRVPEYRTNIEKAHAYPNGDLLAIYTGIGATPYGYGMVKIDKNSHVIWKYSDNMHHDFYVAEDGTIYGLSHHNVRRPLEGLEFLRYPQLADQLDIISSDGHRIKSISILAALRDSPYATLLHQRSISNNNWDYTHTNSVMKLEPEMAKHFPMFKPGQILISMRNPSIIAVLDPEKEQIIWAATGPWLMQHSASFLENGNILLFDDLGASFGRRTSSRILEIDPATLAIKWSYGTTNDTRFYCFANGRAQRLANGNTFITDSLNARLLEVTHEGKTVWEFKTDNVRIGDGNHDIINLNNPKQQLPEMVPNFIQSEYYPADSLPFLNNLEKPTSQENPHAAPLPIH